MSGIRHAPPPRRMNVMRGSCRVHGSRYLGCPLDMIDAARAPSIMPSITGRIVGWVAVLLFLAWLFG